MKDFPETLDEYGIELRRIKPTFELAKEVFEIVERNREYLGYWLPWVARTNSVTDEYDGLSHVYNKEWTYLIFKDNKVIGSIGFVKREESKRKVEIGYWLDKKFGGNGIMTNAVKILEKAVFEIDGWNKIEIHCDTNNISSQNIPKRLGYNLDGILRQDFPYPDGRIGDTMVFSKLKSEFVNN
ncbi:MAG TPA: GNAT family N-acetyltransferase [Alphaproteobacteria bacterium]|nr:GNAT family N-acetyltransferase [Alphaproteobacteria bacterium]